MELERVVSSLRLSRLSDFTWATGNFLGSTLAHARNTRRVRPSRIVQRNSKLKWIELKFVWNCAGGGRESSAGQRPEVRLPQRLPVRRSSGALRSRGRIGRPCGCTGHHLLPGRIADLLESEPSGGASDRSRYGGRFLLQRVRRHSSGRLHRFRHHPQTDRSRKNSTRLLAGKSIEWRPTRLPKIKIPTEKKIKK